MKYEEFLEQKRIVDVPTGLDVVPSALVGRGGP